MGFIMKSSFNLTIALLYLIGQILLDISNCTFNFNLADSLKYNNIQLLPSSLISKSNLISKIFLTTKQLL